MEPIYIIILATVGLAVFLGIVNSANAVLLDLFKKHSSTPIKSNINTISFLEGMKNLEGLDYTIARTRGKLTDCYVPSKKIIALSDETFNTSSVASIAVVAHELGHAIQHKRSPFAFNIVRFVRSISSIFGSLVFPAIITAALMFLLNINVEFAFIIFYIALGIAASTLLSKMLTIPLEYSASNIALEILRKYAILDEEELQITKQITNAAAFTYVAEFIKDITGINLFKKRS